MIARGYSFNVGRDLHGDVVLGSKTINQINDPAPMNPDELRTTYLTRLLDNHNHLVLGGIDPKVATTDNSSLALSAV